MANLPICPCTLKVVEHYVPKLIRTRYIKIHHVMDAEQDWVIVKANCDTKESACEIVLSNAPNIKVMEPIELAEEVLLHAKTLISMHESITL